MSYEKNRNVRKETTIRIIVATQLRIMVRSLDADLDQGRKKY